jgi:hypothetical protein
MNLSLKTWGLLAGTTICLSLAVGLSTGYSGELFALPLFGIPGLFLGYLTWRSLKSPAAQQPEVEAAAAPLPKSQAESVNTNSIEQVEEILASWGYDLLPYGAATGGTLLMAEGSSAYDVAARIVTTTIARDAKEAQDDWSRSIAIREHGILILHALKPLKDQQLLDVVAWKNYSSAIYHVCTPDGDQLKWMDNVLAHPVASREPMAKSRVDYAGIAKRLYEIR